MDWILSSVLGPVCERVIDAAIEEYRLVRDVKEEIKNLRTRVAMIKGVLEDAERKKDDGSAIGEWLKSLKQILFDAEDVFDEIATDEALQRDAKDGTSRLSKVRKLIFGADTSSSSRATALQLKDINKKFDEISKDKELLGLHVSNEPSGAVVRPIRRPPPDTSSLLPKEARIIGRDDEMRKIKELLLLEYSVEGTVAATSDYNKNVDVISVVGMGGVGKTTLVQHAYNNTEVGNYFQLRMWVCVSNYFDKKNIAVKIIEGASKFEKAKELRECSNWDVVQNGLRDLIEGKRFLLVLDDVWEESPSKWDSLYTPLSYGARGSKIIVTTRSQTVSNITKGIPIFLKDLPSEDLVTILQNYAFVGHDPDTQLAQVGSEIVMKLKGSPLAARTIGRVLNANLDVRHWKNISSSKAWVSPDSEDSILPILKLSYDHLPGHLKQCFALCSLFPEDHQFDKDELVELWTAHQLIQIREDFSHVESEGGVYLDKLVHMSLFEKSTSPNGDRYVMHDLIHNLADLVSKDDCLRLEDNHQNGTISETIRHVSITSDRFVQAPKIEQLCKYENMRTLLFMHSYIYNFQLDPHLDKIFKNLRRLRVLGLSRCDIKELPASIGALKHLRLLDLSINCISKLPESLCNLRNLQVLNLEDCDEISALPRNMSALINLRHLFVHDDGLVSGIQGLGKLTALHELDGFDCARQPMKELADMGMLRRLRITSLEEVKSREEAIQSRLDKKEHLDDLILAWSRGRDVDDRTRLKAEEILDGLQPPHSSIRRLSILYFGGSRSPSWMEDQSWLRDSYLLRTLELESCTNWEVLPPLGQLLCLDSLKIKGMRRVRRIGPAFMGCCRQLPQGGFPSLQVLEFEDMEEWEEWEVPLLGTDIDDGGEVDQVVFSEAPPLPLFLARLRELTIRKCPKLRQLPPLPPTLTKLHIELVGLTHLPGWRPSSSLPCCCPSSSSSSPYSLCSVKISDCPNLEGDDDGENDQMLLEVPPPRRQHHRRPLFLARLRELTIRKCPKLRQLPPLPPTLTKVSIGNVGLTHLPEWRLPPSSSSSSLLPCCSSSSLPSYSLSSLEISDCPELTSLADGLMRHPPTLTKLEISKVGLTHLPEWWLPPSSSSSPYSLCSLYTDNCPNLEGDDDGQDDLVLSLAPPPPPRRQYRRRPLFLAPIRELTIVHCPKLRQLPPLPPTLTKLEISKVRLTHLPEWWLPPSSSSSCSSSPCSLSSLVIDDCPELTSLAGGLLRHPLPNLVNLEIRNCRDLVSLPPDTAFGHLTSLKKLVVARCPQLRQLPPLPPTLTKLEISKVRLTHLPEWLLPPSSSLPCPSSSSSSSSPYSLCSLMINDCPNLEGDDDGEDDLVLSLAPPPRRHHHRRPLFLARLRELRIWDCPKLRQLPPLPPTLTTLEIRNVGLTHLPEWQLPPSSLLPSSLFFLVISDCPELTSLADGLLRHPLPNLVHLEICHCKGLVSLPADTAFGHLTSLKDLTILNCPKLAWPSVEEEEDTGGLPPSLERITISGVCVEVMDQMMLAIVGSRQKLACLTYLRIVGTCFSTLPPPPTLRRSLPSSLEELTIWNIDQLDDETLSAWLRGLTSLRQLSIRGCPAVTSLPRAEVLSHLTALKRLSITSSFSGGVHCVVSLEELTIGDCPELLDITTTTAADSSRPSSSSSALPSPARSSVGTSTTTRIRKLEISGSSMQQIKTWLLQCPSIQVLRICRCPQLTGFGGNHNDGGDDVGGELETALLNLSGTLQLLAFRECENLRSLPPRLRCLSSLQSLTIRNCPRIPSLPVAGLPESLRYLRIVGCHPELVERCKEGVGSDWPLISHIPEDRRSISRR